jgi:hypothetical protein
MARANFVASSIAKLTPAPANGDIRWAASPNAQLNEVEKTIVPI